MSDQPGVAMVVGGVSNNKRKPTESQVDQHNKLVLMRYAMLQEKVGDIANDLHMFGAEFADDQVVMTIISEAVSSLEEALESTRSWTPPEG